MMAALNVNALPTSSTTCLKFKVELGVSLHKSINSHLQNRVKGPPRLAFATLLMIILKLLF